MIALNVIPFVDTSVGVIVFAAASILKDMVNREPVPENRASG